jgi:hypothetical protein
VLLAHRHADPAARLVSGEHGRQERLAAQIALLGDGPGRRDDDTAGMGNRIPVQVVHLQDVRQAAQVKGAAGRVASGGRRDGGQDSRRLRLKRAKRTGQRIEDKERRLT